MELVFIIVIVFCMDFMINIDIVVDIVCFWCFIGKCCFEIVVIMVC